jgi:signal transduction histidine kinase
MEGQWVEAEMEDPRLGRYLNFQIHPISSQTQRKNKVTASFAALIIDDISKRKQVEAERENLIKELDAFAHTVAHDLQGSLAPVIGFADLLAKTHQKLPPARLQEILEMIGQGGRKMSQIIKELLLLASARSKDVKMERLDMAAIVAEARQRLASIIEEKQARITLPGQWPAAWGYGPWIEEVWLNYLSNALKYGGQPPQVELGAASDSDGTVRFWVRDYGPGLQPEDQARLFAPFTRFSRTRDGHGVGLSIVQRIVERLGGQVGVESSGIAGQGCTFFFTLPGVTD